MVSMGLITMLVLGGAALAWLEHSYFQGMFKLTDPDSGPDATGFLSLL